MNCDVDAEKAKSADVVGDVQHRPLHMVRLDLFVLIGPTLHDQSLSSNHAFTLVEEPAVLRAPRHKEWRKNTDDRREETLEEKDVAPGVDDH